MCYLSSSYIAKENERRVTLGMQQDESSIELEDNKELIQHGMMAEITLERRRDSIMAVLIAVS